MTNLTREYTKQLKRTALEYRFLDCITKGHYSRAYLIALKLEGV